MAELVFSLEDVTLTSTWTIAYRNMSGSIFYGDLVSANSAADSRVVAISGIPEGESVMSAVLSAKVSILGDVAKSDTESVWVNGLNFYSGVRKIDSTEFTNGSDWTAEFSFYCDTDSGVLTSNAYSTVTYSNTLYLTEITLTIKTGTGSVFDGKVSSLNEGDKILIVESGDSSALYTLVHHEYNTGKALLFRDASVTTSRWRYTAPSYASANSYQDSTLDLYINGTWFPTLPETTRQYLVQLDYPVAESNNSGSTTITRDAATISAIETGEGGSTNYGSPLNYTDTINIGEAYWTREPVGGMAEYARLVNSEGTLSNQAVTNAYGVRPTLGVLEEQTVMWSEDDGAYIFASPCTAPEFLYLNGSEADLSDLQRETILTLSWSEGTAGENVSIAGYAVWYATSEDGTYELYGTTTDLSMAIIGPVKGFETYYFKVQTLGPEDAEYSNSELSTACRMAATKRTNVNYYDGSRWLLGMPTHYNGSSWKQSEGLKYFNGTEWIVPGS